MRANLKIVDGIIDHLFSAESVLKSRSCTGGPFSALSRGGLTGVHDFIDASGNA